MQLRRGRPVLVIAQFQRSGVIVLCPMSGAHGIVHPPDRRFPFDSANRVRRPEWHNLSRSRRISREHAVGSSQPRAQPSWSALPESGPGGRLQSFGCEALGVFEVWLRAAIQSGVAAALCNRTPHQRHPLRLGCGRRPPPLVKLFHPRRHSSAVATRHCPTSVSPENLAIAKTQILSGLFAVRTYSSGNDTASTCISFVPS